MRDRFPIPIIEELLDELKKARGLYKAGLTIRIPSDSDGGEGH